MQPVRKVLGATHFHSVRIRSRRLNPFPPNKSSQLQVEVPDKDDPSKTVTKLTPCSPGAPGAIEKTWTDIGSDELLEPSLTISDFERAIAVNRKTVTEADVAKHIAFTNESGMCIAVESWQVADLSFGRVYRWRRQLESYQRLSGGCPGFPFSLSLERVSVSSGVPVVLHEIG